MERAGKRKILMVAPEVEPLAKVGGLADVAGSLSKALDERGYDVRIVMPRYRGLRHAENAVPRDLPLVVRLGGHEAYARVWETPLPGSTVTCYLLEHNQYFDSSDVYGGPGGPAATNDRRFTFLARAAIDLCAFLDWWPDVFHCHDWSAALVPVYLNTTEASARAGQAASVLTIHNLQHQGWFPRDIVSFAGLPESVFRSDCLESQGEANFLKGGIYNATKITTVSPTYAREIQMPEGGCGLHNLLRFRSPDLIGALNGIDTATWDPATDTYLPRNYTIDDLSGKAACKARLQGLFGLEADPDTPVFTVVSRLVEQKGLDLLAAAGDRLMRTMSIQIAVLGTGQKALEATFRDLAERYPGRFAAHIGFDDERAHLAPAGGDFLLMPSRFEPCGLSQMYAMRYGTPPVARATGGLVDSIDAYEEGLSGGTGFLFRDGTAQAFHDAIGWACSTYYDRPGELAQLRLNGMRKDFSWSASADAYESVYGWAIDSRSSAYSGVS